MNRSDREITDKEEINELLEKGKFATIAFCRNNEPYIATLNYGFDFSQHALYFHAALKGLKIEFLKTNPLVCATIIEDGGYLMDECSHAYRSVIINGTTHIVEQNEEKMRGMNILIEHLEENPDIVKTKSLKSGRWIKNTAILRLDVLHLTAKHGR